MAQAVADNEYIEIDLEKWAEKAIVKEETRKSFVEYFVNDLGATTFEDLAEIYETDTWYKIVDKESGKQSKEFQEKVKLAAIPWKKFILTTEKVKKALDDKKK